MITIGRLPLLCSNSTKYYDDGYCIKYDNVYNRYSDKWVQQVLHNQREMHSQQALFLTGIVPNGPCIVVY